jgi:hypothetical protein
MLDTNALNLQRDRQRLPDQPWTAPQLRDRLAEAAHTLRRLPWPKHGKPQPERALWPDVAHDWMAYGWQAARLQRIPPTAQEVSRMDEVLAWLLWLTRDQRLILWGRANHWAWAKLVQLDDLERNGNGRRERQLRQILGDAEARILAKLNGTPGRIVV